MLYRSFCFVLALFLCCKVIYATTFDISSASGNSQQLLVSQYPYVSLVDTGENCIWSFDLDTASIDMRYRYQEIQWIDTTFIYLQTPYVNYLYSVVSDTLSLLMYETENSTCSYTQGEPIYTTSLSYNQVLESLLNVECYSIEQGKYKYTGKGCSSSRIDGLGKLVLWGDTISDIIRLTTLRQYNQFDNIPTNVSWITHQWYATSASIRVPVMESNIVESDAVVVFSNTILYLTEHNMMHSSAHVETIDKTMDEEVSRHVEWTVSPNPVCSILRLTCSSLLERDEQVNVKLYSVSGNLLFNKDYTLLDEWQAIELTMSDYPNGVYTLKITHQSKVYPTIIIKH